MQNKVGMANNSMVEGEDRLTCHTAGVRVFSTLSLLLSLFVRIRDIGKRDCSEQ